ncbi:ribbon-helix-helix domain-containing protein [Candidatus Bathyarchaeota archaeon]|nr:ribbon-helix-helix domain-containing protein [Candidatus Bathyarchaeota archaeon]
MPKCKISISLSEKCVELMDQLSDTSGLDSRSQVLEEAIFAVYDIQSAAKSLAEWFTNNPNSDGQTATFMLSYSIITLTSPLTKFYRFPNAELPINF